MEKIHSQQQQIQSDKEEPQHVWREVHTATGLRARALVKGHRTEGLNARAVPLLHRLNTVKKSISRSLLYKSDTIPIKISKGPGGENNNMGLKLILKMNI